jgi:hypothetical protein
LLIQANFSLQLDKQRWSSSVLNNRGVTAQVHQEVHHALVQSR